MSLHSFFLRTISQTIFQGNSFGGEEALWRGRSSFDREEARLTGKKLVWRGRSSFGGEEARLAGKKLVWRGRGSCGRDPGVARILVWWGNWCRRETGVAGKLVWHRLAGELVWPGNSYGRGTRWAGELVWPGNFNILYSN